MAPPRFNLPLDFSLNFPPTQQQPLDLRRPFTEEPQQSQPLDLTVNHNAIPVDFAPHLATQIMPLDLSFHPRLRTMPGYGVNLNQLPRPLTSPVLPNPHFPRPPTPSPPPVELPSPPPTQQHPPDELPATFLVPPPPQYADPMPSSSPLPILQPQTTTSRDPLLSPDDALLGPNRQQQALPQPILPSQPTTSRVPQLPPDDALPGPSRQQQATPPTDERPFIIRVCEERYSRKYQVGTLCLNIQFRNLSRFGIDEIGEILYEAFENIIREQIHARAQSFDRARLVIRSDVLDSNINFSFAALNEWTALKILEKLEMVDQSKKGLLLSDSLQIDVILLKAPRPGGRGPMKRKFLDMAVALSRKRSVICIKNPDDNMCLARALVVAIELAHKKRAAQEKTPYNNQRYKNMIDFRVPLQRKEAKILCTQAQVDPARPCAIPELERFQDFLLPQFQIVVYLVNTYKELFYKRDLEPQPAERLNLLYHENHYHVLTSVAGYFEKQGYCTFCDKPIDNPGRHLCKRACIFCKDPGCPIYQAKKWRQCSDCQGHFQHDLCFQRHKSSDTCNKFHRCLECHKQYATAAPAHVCQDICPVCRISHPPGNCFVLTGKEKELATTAPQDLKYIYYDFETREHPETHLHVPELCCVDFQDVPGGPFQSCHFSGETCVADFINFITSTVTTTPPARGEGPPRKKQKLSTKLRFEYANVIAHNAKGFDAIFILQYLASQKFLPEVIFNGAKIMLINLSQMHIKFIDSFSFISLPLRSFPKAFHLHETKKGHFPFALFNAEPNYKGPFPRQEHFPLNQMSKKDQEEFELWHAAEQTRLEGAEWDIRQELLDYCKSDVKLLQEGCEQYKIAMKKLTRRDPFAKSITISSFCNTLLREDFLPMHSLGIVPASGYSTRDVQSQMALKWLAWVQNENPRIQLQTAASPEGEKLFLKYKVDGYDAANKTIYEFLGCRFHGHLGCVKPQDPSHDTRLANHELFQKTLDRRAALQNHLPDHHFVYLWECEFKTLLHENPAAKQFCNQVDVRLFPVTPRAALYGGRTEAFCAFREPTPGGGRLRYMDFTSLYPFVCKKMPYPRGHPIVVHPPYSAAIDAYFGLMSVTVLAPYSLRVPVLPWRHEKKLYFALCRACVIIKQKGRCRHNQEERAFTGCWATPELYTALKVGYQILKIHDVWHYEERFVHDPATGQDGLFTKYVDTFMAWKIASSGWPAHVTTDQEKTAFLQHIKDTEGLEIDPANVAYNAGIRLIAKTKLNSAWGFFALQTDKTSTQFVDNYPLYFKILNDPSRELTDVRIINDDVIMVTTKPTHVPAHKKGNVVVASFVAMYGRVELYKVLSRLKPEQLCYSDTDSVVFVENPSDPPLPNQGTSLGQLSDEIAEGYGPDVSIQKFICCGPKNYAMQLSNGKSIVKIKGFTLKAEAAKILTVECLEQMVRGQGPDKISIPVPFNLVRDKATLTIKNKPLQKQYRQINDKRYFLPGNLKTNYPYGYLP